MRVYYTCGTDPTPGNGHPLLGFAITLTGHATIGRIPLNE